MDKNNTDLYKQKLKTIRINSFLSQKAIAAKLKISQQAYGKIEDGKIQLTIKRIEKLCKIFKIDVDDFLTINPTNSKLKNRSFDSHNVKVLKLYYERLLIQKDLRIGELEIRIKHLNKDRAVNKGVAKLRVPI